MPQAVDRHCIVTLLSPGGIVAACVATIAFLPPATLFFYGIAQSSLGIFDPYVQRILFFTLFQAMLSTLFSLAFALPVALALWRGELPGRGFILRVFAVPLALPQLVGVLGIISIYGKHGVINFLLSALGLPTIPPVFGLPGILLAHVFYNMPFAVRLMVAALNLVPKENWRLGESLGFSRWGMFRNVEWPFLRTALPGTAALIFMLCATSFTIVLTLGGGPQATTLEVAIYQALRFDFDPPTAACLASLQIFICGLLMIFLKRLSVEIPFAERLGPAPRGRSWNNPGPSLVAAGLTVVAAIFVGAPLAAVVVDGLTTDISRLAGDPAVWRAFGTSFAVSVAGGVVAACVGSMISSALARSRGFCAGFLDLAGRIVLVVPPLVIGAGWFLLLYRITSFSLFAPAAVVLINSIMAQPFLLPLLVPSFRSSYETHDRLAATLGLEGFWRFRLVDWPLLRRPITLALLIGCLVSLGDFGIIAFFGSENFTTLPLLLYERLGSYRIDDAAGLAFLLLAFSLLLSFMIDRTVRKEQLR